MGKVFHHDTRGYFGKLRLPGRAIYKDLDRVTFIDVLETSPGEKHFNLHKEVNGGFLLSYEYELRAEALRLSGRRLRCPGCTMDRTEWMQHWVQLIPIANSGHRHRRWKRGRKG